LPIGYLLTHLGTHRCGHGCIAIGNRLALTLDTTKAVHQPGGGSLLLRVSELLVG
jgi:hypothetical protein